MAEETKVIYHIDDEDTPDTFWLLYLIFCWRTCFFLGIISVLFIILNLLVCLLGILVGVLGFLVGVLSFLFGVYGILCVIFSE